MPSRTKSKKKKQIKVIRGENPGQKPDQSQFEHPDDPCQPEKSDSGPDQTDSERSKVHRSDLTVHIDKKQELSTSLPQFPPNGWASQKRENRVKMDGSEKNRLDEPVDAFGQPLTGPFADILITQVDGNQTDGDSTGEPVKEPVANPDDDEEEPESSIEMSGETDDTINALLGLGSEDEDDLARENSEKSFENGPNPGQKRVKPDETDQSDPATAGLSNLAWMADATAAMQAAEKAQRAAMELNVNAFKAKIEAGRNPNDKRLEDIAMKKAKEADEADRLAQTMALQATKICGNFAAAGGSIRSNSRLAANLGGEENDGENAHKHDVTGSGSKNEKATGLGSKNGSKRTGPGPKSTRNGSNIPHQEPDKRDKRPVGSENGGKGQQQQQFKAPTVPASRRASRSTTKNTDDITKK